MEFNVHVDRLMVKALELMEQQGADLIEVDDKVSSGGGGDSFTLMLYEFKEGLNRYLASTDERVKVKSLSDVIDFNRKQAEEVMPYFQQEILEMAEEARLCMKRAVHDELVKKAKLGQDVIINRNGQPYKVSAEEALRIQEEGAEYTTQED